MASGIAKSGECLSLKSELMLKNLICMWIRTKLFVDNKINRSFIVMQFCDDKLK